MPPKHRRPAPIDETEVKKSSTAPSSSLSTPQRNTSGVRGTTPSATPASSSPAQSRRASMQPHGGGALITTTPRKASITDPMAGSPHPPGSFPYRAEVAFNKFAVSEAASHKVLPIVSVQNALFALELNPSAARVADALAHDGYSHRGLLLSDFQRLCKQFLATYASLDAMVKNFKALDTDEDDKISREQFAEFIGDLPPGDRIAGRSLSEVMESLDPEKTGMIYLRSFLKALFPDFTDEEICAAMLENGCDPQREEREMEERAAKAVEEALKAREEARRAFEVSYDNILSEERMLRAEIHAEQREETDEELSKPYEVIEKLLSEKKIQDAELAEQERLREKAALERAGKERAEAERLANEAAAVEEERKRAERAEADKAKAKAAEEERLKKEKAAAEEAERKRKREEEEKAEKAKKAAEPPVAAKPQAKEGGGCCVLM